MSVLRRPFNGTLLSPIYGTLANNRSVDFSTFVLSDYWDSRPGLHQLVLLTPAVNCQSGLTWLVSLTPLALLIGPCCSVSLSNSVRVANGLMVEPFYRQTFLILYVPVFTYSQKGYPRGTGFILGKPHQSSQYPQRVKVPLLGQIRERMFYFSECRTADALPFVLSDTHVRQTGGRDPTAGRENACSPDVRCASIVYRWYVGVIQGYCL